MMDQHTLEVIVLKLVERSGMKIVDCKDCKGQSGPSPIRRRNRKSCTTCRSTGIDVVMRIEKDGELFG